MERRETQRSTLNQETSPSRRAGELKKTTNPELKLAIQSNQWLRIGLVAKDKTVRFNNLLTRLNVESLREAYRALDGSKARGIDGVTKRDYGVDLDGNLENLVTRIHRGTYRPQSKRRVMIPKANGKERPIAISCFEDKLVEWVLSKVLNTIYEPLFIKTSFGFREKKGAHGAIQTIATVLSKGKYTHVVEIDFAKFFDTINHRRMILTLQKRINDRRFTGLVSRFLEVGIFEEQTQNTTTSTMGAPQGSVMSPVLANVFLTECLDQWFLDHYGPSGSLIVRYADDAIFAFKTEKEATDFKVALKQRIELYGLELNEEKTKSIKMGSKDGNIFNFLGFTFYWGQAHGSKRKQLKVKTAKETLRKKLAEYSEWIKKVRSTQTINRLWKLTASKLRGHYNYYGFMSNLPKLNYFYRQIVWTLFRALNRKSQKGSYSWKGFNQRLLFLPLPVPPHTQALKPIDTQSIYAGRYA